MPRGGPYLLTQGGECPDVLSKSHVFPRARRHGGHGKFRTRTYRQITVLRSLWHMLGHSITKQSRSHKDIFVKTCLRSHLVVCENLECT